MLWLWCSVVMGVGLTGSTSPDPKSLSIPADELARARELVQRLGSEQFVEREQAETELAKMGRLARPALVEGANTDPSPEVRSRCSSLLPRAVSLDFRARLDVFLADTAGRFEHELPGWNQFRATIRNEWRLFGFPVWSDPTLDRAARTVFADLITSAANRPVVLAAGGSAPDLGQVVAARRQELHNQKFPRAIVIGGVVAQPGVARDPAAEDLASLLFAESHLLPRFAPRTPTISNLITTSGFVGAIQGNNDRAKVYRAIVVAWLETRRDALEMYQALNIATTLKMPDHGIRMAIRLLTATGATPAYRGMAATHLARYGTKEHIPLLEKVMSDETVLTTIRENIVNVPIAQRPTHDLQVRDVALAVSLLLAGQTLEEYGFVDQFRGNTPNLAQNYTYTRYFLPAAKRQAAFQTWKNGKTPKLKGKADP